MKLFTKDIDRLLFRQFNKGGNLDAQEVVAKIFNPYGHGRWYLLNSDPDDEDYIWAIVQMGNNVEVGSVSRSELESIRVTPFKFKLERDLGFRSVNAGELFRGLQQGKFYKKGGWVENENKEMAENQANEVKHHSEELSDALKNTDHVEAWVVGKMERATTDLSDVTHYLDGESKKMESGGELKDKIEEVKKDAKDSSKRHKNKTYVFDYEFNKDNGMKVPSLSERITWGQEEDLQYFKEKGWEKYFKVIAIYENGEEKMAWGGKMADGGMTEEKEKRAIKEYEEHVKNYYNKVINYWRSKKDDDIAKFNNKDLNNHLSVIDDMKNGNWGLALYTWRSMDTSAREEITKDAYNILLSKNDKMEKGGVVKWQDVQRGDNARVKDENKMGVIMHTYGRKFNVRFVDGTEKTYDASELEFFKDDEYADGGYMEKGGKTKSVGLKLLDLEFMSMDLLNEGEEIPDLSPSGTYSKSEGKIVAIINEFNISESEFKKVASKYMALDLVYDNFADTPPKIESKKEEPKGDLRDLYIVEIRKYDDEGDYTEEDFEFDKKSDALDFARTKGNVHAIYYYPKGTDSNPQYLWQSGGVMKSGGIFEKIKHYGKKGVEKTKQGYGKAKDYTKKQIHDKKKKIALEVIDDTKDSITNQRDKIHLRASEDFIERLYDKGGMTKEKVTFSDKVKSIQKSLLKRKKVSPKVQKDYGKTYNKKEALESAKRIAGAMRKKEK